MFATITTLFVLPPVQKTATSALLLSTPPPPLPHSVGTAAARLATTQLSAAAVVVVDYASAANSFFTSIRIPAALIAGSSLAAFFTFADRVQTDDNTTRTRAETLALLLYHILGMLALLLSLNVVIVSTATSNTLLLWGINSSSNSRAAAATTMTSVYDFMMRECELEFLLTRWSFFVSLFAFLGCVVVRALLEFRLLCRKRVRSAICVISSVGAMGCHLLAFVNARLGTWPNLMAMTVALVRAYVETVWTQQRSPMALASFVCLCTACISGLSLFPRIALFSNTPTTTTAPDVSSSNNSSGRNGATKDSNGA